MPALFDLLNHWYEQHSCSKPLNMQAEAIEAQQVSRQFLSQETAASCRHYACNAQPRRSMAIADHFTCSKSMSRA
jgi:hypothetical protein